MDIAQFFERVLPTAGNGHHILVCRKPFTPERKNRAGKVQTFWVTRAFNNFSKMAQQAKMWSTEGFDTYHACASFKQINWETKTNKNTGNQYKIIHDTRTQFNAAFTRAQWLDIDVGPGKDYETREEALTALAAVCGVLGVPMPMVVSSGRTGLHCYWVFTQDLPAETAALLMGSFLLALEETDFQHDVSRTADTASVLRPIGTKNYKEKQAYKVQLLSDADPVNAKKFYKPFSHLIGKARLLQSPDAAAEANMFDELGVAIRGGAKPSQQVLRMGDASKWGEIDRDTLFAPYSIKLLTPECAVMKMFVKQRPNMEPIPEPLWRGLLGLTMCSMEGRKMAHQLSARSDDRYEPEDADAYMDRWVFGPTSCKYFSGHSDKCQTCPHLGKITSPKSLGEPEVEAVTLEIQPAQASPDEVVVEPDQFFGVFPSELTLPYWDDERYLADKLTGRMKRPTTAEELKENPKLPAWLDFSRTIYYARLRYYNQQEAKYMVKFCAQTGVVGDITGWREFEVEGKVTNDANQLSTALANNGVTYMGQKNKNSNLGYVQDMLQGLKAHGLEATTYSSFGWHDDGFVLGDNFLTGLAERPVFVSDHLPDALQGDYGRAGTVEGWAAGVDHVYNREGAEPYQFMVLCGFASPLIHLNNAGGMWHGLSVGATGPSGIGKTTAAKVACSIYGNPTTATVQANPEGSTLLALVARMGAMRNLPMIMDEITGRELRDLQALLYSITAGKPKAACEQSGNERATPHEWAMIPFVTGNENITAMLGQGMQAQQAATQVRCFEISLEADFNKRVFGDLDGKEVIEHQLLGKQYGEVGIEWLQFLIRNKDKVAALQRKIRSDLAKKFPAENEERFYYDLLSAVLAAGKLAKKRGYIKFNVTKVRDWALAHIRDLRAQRKETDHSPGDYLQMLLEDMHKRTVVTEYWSRGKASKLEDPNDAPHLYKPCVRRATKSQRYMITRNGFNEWCMEKKLLPRNIINSFEREGIIVPPETTSDRASLFSGLTPNVGLGNKQTRVIELRYSAIAEVEGAADKQLGQKVTSIR